MGSSWSLLASTSIAQSPVQPQLSLVLYVKGDKMIVKSQDGKRKSFYGVDFIVLSHGSESMTTKMLYKIEDKVPFHSHPNEQSGYVLNGKYRIKFSEYDQ